MPLTERQLAAFADAHLGESVCDVSPRYLAGPGDARHVTHALATAGWTPRSDPLAPTVALDLRERSLDLAHDPQSPTAAWLLRSQPHANAPGWFSEFGALVPTEIISSVIDALIKPPPSRWHDPFAVLIRAGWQSQPAAAGPAAGSRTVQSPDGLCRVHQSDLDRWAPGSFWQIETTAAEDDSVIWRAWASGSTPTHLVSAFAAALCDPAPLHRLKFARLGHRSVEQQPSALTAEQFVEAHTARIASLRAIVRAQQRPDRTLPPLPLANRGAVASAKARR
ncbi:DUF317 domain-containing protein [Streptomyces diastaticus]|uniref:DUF317 domain-containing protein n=1 Tax=Streptomyces diastaticus TaxID=1956 RepID=UPI003660F601